MNTKEMLEAQIQTEFERIKEMSNGEEKSKAILNLEKLYKLKLNDDEIENNYAIAERKAFVESEKIDNERVLGEVELKENKISKFCQIALKVFETGAPLILSAVFLNRGFKFEETGVYGSKTFGTLFSKFRIK